MAFLNVFSKTLGFLLGILVFIVIVNFLIKYIDNNIENNTFNFRSGDQTSENVIGILNLNGVIISNYSNSIDINYHNFIYPSQVSKKLNEIQKLKPKVIIIKVNSPGGTVSASIEVFNIIKKFKSKQKIDIYVYSNEVLASGGYWIAMAADKIFAHYGALIGSIGVSGPSWIYYDKPISLSTGLLGSNIETENGIKIFSQNAGKSKDLYNPFRKPQDYEINHLNSIVNDIYFNFLEAVEQNRKLEKNYLIDEIGALIFNSNLAKENYLIDDVINLEELIKYIEKKYEFKNYKTYENPIKNSFFDRFLTFLNIKYSNNYCNVLKTNFTSILPNYIRSC